MNQIWHEHETIPNHSHSMVMATQGYVLGIEISSAGMQMSVALADLQGQIVHRARKRLSVPPEGQEAVAFLQEIIADVCSPERQKGNRVLRCGIAIGAPVDAARGQVRMMYRAAGWEHLPLQDLVEQRSQIPVILDNDANAAALGEATFGAGIGERNLIYIGLGRGIGGGI